MPAHFRRRFSHEESEPVAPAEGWLVAQTTLLAIFSSWAFGAAVEWTQVVSWWLAVAGLVAGWMRYRETHRLALLPFVPAMAWSAFVGIALLNPSHEPLANGGWAQRLGWIPWLPTTADGPHTLADARVWLTALIQGGLLSALLRRAALARTIWMLISLNGFALAATGAFFHFAGAERMLGVFDTPEPTYFFATFFYKNHWAAYGALAAVVSLALALQAWPAALNGDPVARGRTLVFGGAGLLTAITLPLPGSRAGALMALAIVSGFCALLLVMGWRSARVRKPGRRWAMGFGGLVAAGIVIFGVQAYRPLAGAELARTRSQIENHFGGRILDLRWQVSRDTAKMAWARPWFGWGAGCFEVVFPVFQGNYLRDRNGKPEARFEAAHNDWLQLVAENGLFGAALLLIPTAIVGWRVWRRADVAGRWALAGCAMVALYAWIDFPLHNPAVLILWTIMLTTAHRLRSPPPA